MVLRVVEPHMPRTFSLLIVLLSIAGAAAAAERQWQAGTWGEVTTKRKLIDFGPGASPFGRAGTQPTMRAMADVRRFVIETDQLRLEMEDTVPIGRRSIDPVLGETATFALDKKTVYVRDAEGREHKLRLTKKIERPRPPPER
jgi:hypothetical protein